MQSASLITFQLAVMMLLILFGWWLFRSRHLSDEGNRQLSHLVISFVNPVLIFMAFQTDYDDQLLTRIGWAALMAFTFHVLAVVVSLVLLRRRGGDGAPLEQFAAAYSNCGFIGIPLVQSVYGSEGVLYLTLFIFMFQLFMWTHGVMTVCQVFTLRSALRAFLSPSILAALLGLLLFLLRIRIPELLAEPLNYISSLNTPLAMIVSGATMAQTSLITGLRKPGVYRVAALKLVLLPLALMLIFLWLPVPLEVYQTAVIAASCPSATATIMMAHRYGKDATYAAELFVLVTLFSLITLPLMVSLASLLRPV